MKSIADKIINTIFIMILTSAVIFLSLMFAESNNQKHALSVLDIEREEYIIRNLPAYNDATKWHISRFAIMGNVSGIPLRHRVIGPFKMSDKAISSLIACENKLSPRYKDSLFTLPWDFITDKKSMSCDAESI